MFTTGKVVLQVDSLMTLVTLARAQDPVLLGDWELSSHGVESAGRHIILELDEQDHGDLDGDGDVENLVWQHLDLADTSSVETIHTISANTLEGSPRGWSISEELALFGVFDRPTGGNDCGFSGAFVWHVYDFRSGRTSNLGVEYIDSTGSGTDCDPSWPFLVASGGTGERDGTVRPDGLS